MLANHNTPKVPNQKLPKAELLLLITHSLSSSTPPSPTHHHITHTAGWKGHFLLHNEQKSPLHAQHSRTMATWQPQAEIKHYLLASFNGSYMFKVL